MILPKIKNQPFFIWPLKMGGDISRRDPKLYCSYHRDKGHLTEYCRAFKEFLERLMRDGYLTEFIVEKMEDKQPNEG